MVGELQVREEIQLSSLAKMFLKQQIMTECWDSMTVKGKIIKVSGKERRKVKIESVNGRHSGALWR